MPQVKHIKVQQQQDGKNIKYQVIQLESTSTFYTETATATQSVQTQDSEHPFEHNTWSFK